MKKLGLLTGFSRRAFLCCAVVLAAAVPMAGFAADRRVVAVGDIHGDYNAFVAILQEAGLIDAQLHWTARNTTLVQTGDYLDRGPKSRSVMDLLMALEREAPKKDGRVVVLLGNHEVMNLIGDLRYVTPEEYRSFVDDESEKRRQDAYRSYVEVRRQGSIEPKQWMDAHPPGFVEHRAAFAKEGKYGRWLRAKPVIAKEGSVVFLHGGISPSVADMSIDQINERAKEEIKAFDTYVSRLVENKVALPFYTLNELTAAASEAIEERKLREPEQEGKLRRVLEGVADMGAWLTMNQNGPLWFRGFAQWADEEGVVQIANIARAYGTARFVVGHTVQPEGRMRARFDGRVFLIDTGMLSSYFPGGRASALEIANGKFTAIYRNGREVVFDTAAASRRGR